MSFREGGAAWPIAPVCKLLRSRPVLPSVAVLSSSRGSYEARGGGCSRNRLFAGAGLGLMQLREDLGMQFFCPC